MRKILPIIMFILLGISIAEARTVYNPSVMKSGASKLKLKEVVLGDSTILRFTYKLKPNYWYQVIKSTYISYQENGRTVTLRVKDADGIKLGEQQYMNETGIAEFDLYFDSIPSTVEEIDFTEDGDWYMKGICLKEDAELSEKNGPFFSYFSKFSDYCVYTYFSPLMLKTMDTSKLGNLPTSRINMMEKVNSTFLGPTDEIKKAIKNAIKRGHLELLSHEGNEKNNTSIHVRWFPEQEYFGKILVVKTKNHSDIQILYLEGQLTQADLKNLL